MSWISSHPENNGRSAEENIPSSLEIEEEWFPGQREENQKLNNSQGFLDGKEIYDNFSELYELSTKASSSQEVEEALADKKILKTYAYAIVGFSFFSIVLVCLGIFAFVLFVL